MTTGRKPPSSNDSPPTSTPLPSDELILRIIALVEGYAADGITDINEAWAVFEQEIGQGSQQLQPAFESAWALVHDLPEASVDLDLVTAAKAPRVRLDPGVEQAARHVDASLHLEPVPEHVLPPVSPWRVIRLLLGVPVAIMLLATSCGVEFDEGMPDNAMLVVDDVRKVYVSPPCMEQASARGDLAYVAAFQSTPRVVEAGEVRGKGKGYAPEEGCINMSFAGPGDAPSGGFGGVAIGPIRELLVLTGLAERPSRWKTDGTWAW